MAVIPPSRNSMTTSAGATRHNPLLVSYPSPMLFLQYPLFATNVRLLCEKDDGRARKQNSLATTFLSLRLVYQAEGLLGLYRGAHLYLLHQVARDALRLFLDRGIGYCHKLQAEDETSEDQAGAWSLYRFKLAAKYAIDALCYPILLASTRVILLRDNTHSTWQRLRYWCREEGVLSLFNGLSSSLLSTAFDEIMDLVLEGCIERCATGSEISTTDKLMLKACSTSVASVFTAPVNSVGVIQRCQSWLPGLVTPLPLWRTLQNLPWLSSFYQFLMFGGILALNVKLIQLKLEMDEGADDE